MGSDKHFKMTPFQSNGPNLNKTKTTTTTLDGHYKKDEARQVHQYWFWPWERQGHKIVWAKRKTKEGMPFGTRSNLAHSISISHQTWHLCFRNVQSAGKSKQQEVSNKNTPTNTALVLLLVASTGKRVIPYCAFVLNGASNSFCFSQKKLFQTLKWWRTRKMVILGSSSCCTLLTAGDCASHTLVAIQMETLRIGSCSYWHKVWKPTDLVTIVQTLNLDIFSTLPRSSISLLFISISIQLEPLYLGCLCCCIKVLKLFVWNLFSKLVSRSVLHQLWGMMMMMMMIVMTSSCLFHLAQHQAAKNKTTSRARLVPITAAMMDRRMASILLDLLIRNWWSSNSRLLTEDGLKHYRFDDNYTHRRWWSKALYNANLVRTPYYGHVSFFLLAWTL